MYAMKDIDLSVMNNFTLEWYSAEFTVYGFNDDIKLFQKITYNPKNKPIDYLNLNISQS